MCSFIWEDNDDKLVNCKICGTPYYKQSEGSPEKNVCMVCYHEMQKKVQQDRDNMTKAWEEVDKYVREENNND